MVVPARSGTLCLLAISCLLLATLPQAASGRSLASFIFTVVPAVPQLGPLAVAPVAQASPAVSVTGAPCSNLASSVAPLSSGSMWHANLNPSNNIAPNATGIPAPPLPRPLSAARGSFDLMVDEAGQRASWKLQLCDVPQYIASHLHIGSTQADYPPPLIPLEPYGKPTNPFGPPTLLPQRCPAITVVGCSYNKQGSFRAVDIIPLPGRAPAGDLNVPTVTNWNSFLSALKAGDIYINVHSLQQPAGLIRGNLFSVGASSSASSGMKTGPSSTSAYRMASTPAASG